MSTWIVAFDLYRCGLTKKKKKEKENFFELNEGAFGFTERHADICLGFLEPHHPCISTSLSFTFIHSILSLPISAGAPLLLTANTVMTLEAAEEEI